MLPAQENSKEEMARRMLLVPQVYFLRCPCNNSLFRTILIFGPVVAFLFLLIACLKWSIYLSPLENEIIRYSKADSQAKKVQMTLLNFPNARELVYKSKTKRFYNEDARRVAFPAALGEGDTKINSSLKIIYLATTYFGEWNPRHYYFFHIGNTTFTRYSCPNSNCYVTKNSSDIFKADAVLFHVRDLEVFSFPQHRSPEQLWILYSMEPPWLEIKDFRRFNGLFNWTMSYRRGSDVLVKYGFIGKKPKNDVNRKHQSYSEFLKQKVHKAVWYVSNCNTDSNREQYIERLRTVYPVDVIGGCGTPGCRPPETKKCYSEVAKRYKFYLAFENAICRDYVTEKLYNPLEYHIIPVVLGGADYTSLTPIGSVINAMEFRSPEDLGKYLWKVSRNDTLYLSYFKWKENYRSYLQPWMCDLCEKLHSTHSPRTHNDLQSWWDEEDSCLKWTTSGFKRIKHHVFPKYNMKLFENNLNHSERE